MTNLTGTYADGALADDLIAYSIAFSFQENVTVSGTFAYAYIPGTGSGFVTTAKAKDVLSTTNVYNVSLTQGMKASAAFTTYTQPALTTNATTSEVYSATLSHPLGDSAKAHDAFQTQVVCNVSVSSAAVASAVAISEKGGSFASNALASGVFAYNYIGAEALTENINAHVALSPLRIAVTSLSANVQAEDAPVPGFVWAPLIQENVWAFEFLEPSGGVTTWAINTRTNAVTQYSNFAFNSFASMGRKYLAADQNGLYELNGARDLTSNVVGTMQGGFFQPADGRLAGFKGVYLAASGQGAWQLTLTAGDGREYTYQRYSNPNLMTTKIEVGKGLRSRYFAWGLAAVDGQDFDLDQIAFVPAVSGRRV